MTEPEARAALRRFVAVGNLEPWIADQPWQAVPGGWTVVGTFQGWAFRVAPLPGEVRVTASDGRGAPAVWTVPD